MEKRTKVDVYLEPTAKCWAKNADQNKKFRKVLRIDEEIGN